MANTLAASGFRVARSYLAAAGNYQLATRRIAYNLSNQIAFGDPVLFNSSGFVDIYVNGGGTIHGVFAGCRYYDPVAQQLRFSNYWPAVSGLPTTQIVEANVIVDPFVTFECQMNGGPVVQGDIGENFDITTSTSGVPNASGAGISTCSLIYSSKATTNTLPFRLVGIVGAASWAGVGNFGINRLYDATAANNWVEVRMNTSDALQTTGI